jgi:hypothetical protein
MAPGAEEASSWALLTSLDKSAIYLLISSILFWTLDWFLPHSSNWFPKSTSLAALGDRTLSI